MVEIALTHHNQIAQKQQLKKICNIAQRKKDIIQKGTKVKMIVDLLSEIIEMTKQLDDIFKVLEEKISI